MMESHSIVPVSVVIPCFRCSKTIGHAVASIAQQTIKPAEVILVDDASGDSTLSVLQELAQAYPGWVKVLRLGENRGAASARNAGWEAASQPYIAFLDADDAWHPEKLRIQYEYMCSNPEVAVSGHQCMWLRDGETPPDAPLIMTTSKIEAISLIFRNCFSTPTVMLKRNIQFRFSDNKRYCEDSYLWQQIAFAGLLVTRMETTLAYIHKAPYGEGGLSAQLWEMEKGELDNLVTLYQAGRINWLLLIVATGFSILKYVKRLVVTWINRTACLLRRKREDVRN